MTVSRQQLLKFLAVTLLFAIAMGMRLEAINGTAIDDDLRADAGFYYLYALHLKYHHVFSGAPFDSTRIPKPDAVRSPGYPLFLTAFVTVPPTELMVWKIQFTQALLGSLTVLVMLAVFRRLMPAGWAFAAALLLAISPHLIMISVYLLSETLFIFLLALSLWLLVTGHRSGSRTLMLLAGAAIALAALTRPTLQYFIVPLCVLLAFAGNRRFDLRLALPMLAGFVLAFTPWTVRNLHAIGSMSDPTLAIKALHHGMYPDFRYRDDPATTGFPYNYDPHSAEIAASKASVLREIRRRFREEPGRHLAWYLLGKPATLLSWDIIQGMGDAFIYPMTDSPYLSQPVFIQTRALMKRLHWPLVILSLAAALLVWLPAAGAQLSAQALFTARLLSLLMLYFIALHMVAAPFPRYGIPLRPSIYGLALLLCAQGLSWLAAGGARHRPQQTWTGTTRAPESETGQEPSRPV